ncbi:MAG: hypothetical protein CNLJKLNK_00531 [Holosporales bacterium]
MVKFVLFLCVGFLNFLDAQIPAVAFKEVTKYFKDPHYSPLMGRVALDSGYIYNLRHFGLFTPAVGENPDGTERRLYDSDTPNDDMMKLLITLFPSSAGPLASESMAVSNFGKNAKIEDVAKMLQFTKAVRKELDRKINLQRNPSETSGRINALFREFQSLGFLRDLILNSIRLEYNPTGKEFASRTKILDNIKKLKGKKRPENGEDRRQMQDAIFTQSENEREIQRQENHIYPLYTTEQIILAFFVHKFNNKEDIYTLMKILGDDFVTPFRESEIWNLGDISSYGDTTDMDYIFIATHHDLNAPIPFKKGNNPISNGICPKIAIVNGKKTITPDMFADCHETAIRQLFSIGFYDARTKTFKIPERIRNNDLRNFFIEQPPHKANDGSSEMRGKWNLVISGLPGIRYRQGMNEIDGGYINMIKAMRAILNIKNDHLPKNKEDVIAAIQDIFMAMNPDLKNIRIDIPNFSSRSADCDGDATITITNAYDQTFSFVLRQISGHVDIQNPTWNDTNILLPELIEREDPILSLVDRRDIKTGIHQLLAMHEFADERQRIDRVKDFSQIESNIKQQYIPVIERMMDLKVDDNENMRNAKEAITPLIQKGFMLKIGADLALSFSDDNFFNMCFEKGKDIVIKQFKEKGMIYLTQNKLSKIKEALPDYQVYLQDIKVHNAFDVLDLRQATALKTINIQGIINTLNLPTSFKNMREIKILLFKNVSISELDLSTATKLKTVELKGINQEKINITKLTLPDSNVLKSIILEGVEITTADLSKTTNLESISAYSDSQIYNFILPNDLKNIETLDLSGKINIQEIDLSKAINLKMLSIGGYTKVDKLILPDDLEKLETFTFRSQSTIDIPTIDLSGARNLKNFSIDNLNIGMLRLPTSSTYKNINICEDVTINILILYPKIFNLDLKGKIEHIFADITLKSYLEKIDKDKTNIYYLPMKKGIP